MMLLATIVEKGLFSAIIDNIGGIYYTLQSGYVIKKKKHETDIAPYQCLIYWSYWDRIMTR